MTNYGRSLQGPNYGANPGTDKEVQPRKSEQTFFKTSHFNQAAELTASR